MDMNKTGVFISTIRKQNNMTQKELAEKIGVTDKAVSRWETGKGFPDVSMLIILAEVLGISISELVMGEKIQIQEEKAVEIAEKALISTLDYSQRERRKILKAVLFWFGNTLPILISIIIYAIILQDRHYLWVRYDAAFLPIYLLVFNFILGYKKFNIKKLLVILSVELVCVLIHMGYFRFDMTPTSLIIWSFMIGTIFAITAIGGLILCLISKKYRNKPIE